MTSVVGWLLRLGRETEAAELAASTVTRDPGDPELYFSLGHQYAETGRHQEALDWRTAGLRRALERPDFFVLERLIARRAISLAALGHGADPLQKRALAVARDAGLAY